MKRSALHLVPVAVLSLFAALAPLHAQHGRDKSLSLPPAPPIPVPVKVNVDRGDKVDIPLRIYGSQKDELAFLIRTPPQHGKLSHPAARGREAAVVTYESPASLAITKDRFTYSVQSPLGVSAPAEVQISIIDKAPNLRIPPSLEFPALLAGQTDTRSIEIANDGGGVAQGSLDLDPPWKVEGAATYTLPPGARQTFKIVFAPQQGGEYGSEIRYTSQRDRFTLLSGKAASSIAADPPQLALRNEPGDASRHAKFALVNNTDDAVTAVLIAGDRLDLLKSVLSRPKIAQKFSSRLPLPTFLSFATKSVSAARGWSCAFR